MKKLLLTTALALALPGFAFAATYKIPDDAPVAAITIPDDWSSKPIDNGVDATSGDGT
ncbi:MAG: histidine kinase, partial [Methylobacteriaceae bacterium]|nr:histidine kinase [Methylobacteriaceae bacterium]